MRDHAQVVGDLLLLRRHEQHIHCALRVGAPPGIQDLVVEIDVLDVERDVLFRLPVDGLGELGFGHHRKTDFLDDDGVARERGGHLLGLERLILEQTADRVGDGGPVDDGAVHDAVRRHWLDAECRDFEALARWLQLDGFDRARADVETDDGL